MSVLDLIDELLTTAVEAEAFVEWDRRPEWFIGDHTIDYDGTLWWSWDDADLAKLGQMMAEAYLVGEQRTGLIRHGAGYADAVARYQYTATTTDLLTAMNALAQYHEQAQFSPEWNDSPVGELCERIRHSLTSRLGKAVHPVTITHTETGSVTLEGIAPQTFDGGLMVANGWDFNDSLNVWTLPKADPQHRRLYQTVERLHTRGWLNVVVTIAHEKSAHTTP